jgi:hypothetical protein
LKKFSWFLAGILLSAGQPAQAFFGRDKIASLWSSAPVQIDGRATEWSDMPLLDEEGIGFRAMNDGANLYLLIGGTAADGRLLLSGKSGQTITLWFLKPDGKTKEWGIDLDFSRAEDPTVDSPTTLGDWGIAAERVVPQGLEVSSTTFPTEIEFQADLSSQRGRQPLYEMRIPLALIEHKGRTIDFDFVTTDITNERRAELLALPIPQAPKKQTTDGSSGAPAGGGGGRHHHGGGAPGGGSAASATDLPKRFTLHLSVGLVKAPKHE